MEAGSFGEITTSEKETELNKNKKKKQKIINVFIESLSCMYVMYVNTYQCI